VTQLLTEPEQTDRAEATPALATPRALRAVAIVASSVVVAIVMAVPWSPVARYFSLPASRTDIGTHVKLAEEIATNGITFSHFLWHFLVVAVHAAAPSSSWMDAAWIVVVGSYALQGALLAFTITMVLPPAKRIHALGVALLALLFVTAAPVTIFTWREGALYYGYLNMSVQQPHTCPPQATRDRGIWFDREGVCRRRELAGWTPGGGSGGTLHVGQAQPDDLSSAGDHRARGVVPGRRTTGARVVSL